MKYRMAFILSLAFLFTVLFLYACDRKNNVCHPVEGTRQPKPALVDLIALPSPPPQTEPTNVNIGGKMIAVDRLVEGPLCNDIWSGTVYVSCDAIVAESYLDTEKNPLFLKGCNLNIDSNTIIYVAAHNDAAYYKGCSCHTGEDPIP